MHLHKTIPILSIPLALLIAVTSIIGIFTEGFYFSETLNWQAQSLGQDTVDLFLVTPALVITSWLAYGNNKVAKMLWGGLVSYLLYTFVIYCFNIHFNKLFLLYCAELGLSAYGTLLFILECRRDNSLSVIESNGIFKFTGIYFILIATVFYLLWLSEILPAVFHNTVPAALSDAGLFTNPVHVLDLSVVLPGIFITGILILQKSSFGFVLAPAVLMFFILMDLTISYLVLLMYSKGLESSRAVAIGMAALALFTIALLILLLKKIRQSNDNVS